MGEFWDSSAPGVMRLPSGRLVRGRALSRPLPDGLQPALGIYLLDRRPPGVPWESRWLRWPDFGLPADPAAVLPALTEAWQRATAERVEIACAGGHGRTGTALACLAILDGLPAATAVAFVREHYDQRAVETPAQCCYVARWPNAAPAPSGRSVESALRALAASARVNGERPIRIRRAAVAELGPSLVGSWRLVSYETKRADGVGGSASHPFGDAPIGLFIFDPDGNYSVQLSNPADSGSRVASWGSYEVDEEQVLFILEPIAGTTQLAPGEKTTRRVTLNGDGTATFRPPVQVVDGVEIQGYITWRKVSGQVTV